MIKKNNTAVIIVNWNGRRLLEDCLISLNQQTYQNFKIILVDNGSVDGSVEYVQEKFILSGQGHLKQIPIETVELSENTGFARGNNIGISKALEDRNIQNVVLLNNDTKVEKDFLEKLIGALNSNFLQNKKVGALAPKMLLWEKLRGPASQKASQKIDAVGARVGVDGRGYNIGHGEIEKGQYDKNSEVFGFCGGAVLLRREALEDVELTGRQKVKIENKKIKYKQYFDDNFFAYYEDADLSWRMQWRGWKIFTVPEAVVWHLHSVTADNVKKLSSKTGTKNSSIKSKNFKAYYLNRNRFLMMLKNFPRKLLWRGLLLVPGSYFGNKNNRGNGRSKKDEKNKRSVRNNVDKQGDKNKRYLEHKENKQRKVGGGSFIRKIIMVGVMIKVGGNFIWNACKIWKQRERILKNKIIEERDLEKWF